MSTVLEKTIEAALYAEAGVPEYWLLDLNARYLEVRRDPMPTPDNRHGFGYRQTTLYQESESISPLAEVRVKDILPHVAVETNNG